MPKKPMSSLTARHPGASEDRVILALSIPNAAAAIGVSARLLYDLVSNSQLSITKVRGRSVIKVDELKRFLDSCPTSARGGDV
jgi:hypothetical protein